MNLIPVYSEKDEKPQYAIRRLNTGGIGICDARTGESLLGGVLVDAVGQRERGILPNIAACLDLELGDYNRLTDESFYRVVYSIAQAEVKL